MTRQFPAFIAGAIAIAFLSPAIAQAPAPIEPSSFTLALTVSDLTYIANVLRQRPYTEVVDLLNKIQTQINEQRDAANKPAPFVPPKTE